MSLYPYSLLIYSSLRAELARKRVGFLPYVIFALKTCIPFGAVPKKSKKTSSKNTTFEISEHHYRTCGSSGDFSSSLILQFSIKNLSFRSGLSQKSRKNAKQKYYFYKKRTPLSHLRLFVAYFSHSWLGGVFSKMSSNRSSGSCNRKLSISH